ncbi:hypothetical protein FGADI_5421 [Fusarium gaditjirri]|uniref:Uncharacterized protein n=1 Tax=Fusarium gaditjirri TaxID=282569 RepID=A0A8H4TA97_9HYPO|nr:hypothetical protein FGADI_5421 [Fusarium gaditjirri]
MVDGGVVSTGQESEDVLDHVDGAVPYDRFKVDVQPLQAEPVVDQPGSAPDMDTPMFLGRCLSFIPFGSGVVALIPGGPVLTAVRSSPSGISYGFPGQRARHGSVGLSGRGPSTEVGGTCL